MNMAQTPFKRKEANSANFELKEYVLESGDEMKRRKRLTVVMKTKVKITMILLLLLLVLLLLPPAAVVTMFL